MRVTFLLEQVIKIRVLAVDRRQILHFKDIFTQINMVSTIQRWKQYFLSKYRISYSDTIFKIFIFCVYHSYTKKVLLLEKSNQIFRKSFLKRFECTLFEENRASMTGVMIFQKLFFSHFMNETTIASGIYVRHSTERTG